MKAAIYCRLSEEDRNKQTETDDSESIRNQKEMLVRYAEEQGWEVYRIYSDDDYAGADRNRPEFRRLLADAEQRRFDIVLCKTQSRFTRELELVEKYLHGLFPLWNIRFVSIVDNADTADRGNKKSRQINGLVNEWYLEDMSENIKSVLTSRRKSGLHIGSFALYGYRKDPQRKGHLIVDEEAAAVVREVFALFAQGYGKTAIARMLNDRGIPNPTEYKRLHGLKYRQPRQKSATLWKYFSISDMLHNEMYIGNMVQGRYGSVSYKTKVSRPRGRDQWYVVEGTHEPIVGRGLWDRVQSLLREKAKPFSAGTVGLFARKVRCMSCGYTLRSVTSRGVRYLQCPTRRLSKDACAGAFLPVTELETAVLAELNRLAAEYLDPDGLERAVEPGEAPRKQAEKLEADAAAYRRRIAEYAGGLRALYLDRARGILSEEDFAAFSAEFRAERERLERAVLDCQNRLKKLETEPDGGGRQIAERYARLGHLSREAVECLIDSIAVGRRTPDDGVPVEIRWNF